MRPLTSTGSRLKADKVGLAGVFLRTQRRGQPAGGEDEHENRERAFHDFNAKSQRARRDWGVV